MTKQEFIAFLEERDWQVSESDENLEIEIWTDRGVDMIMTLDAPDFVQSFIEQAESFDADEQVTLLWGQAKGKEAMGSLRTALNDMDDHKTMLLSQVDELQAIQRAEELQKLPTVMMYQDYLQRVCVKLGISTDEARERYGLFTVGQWEEMLNRKTLVLEKWGMELRGKEAEFSDLQSYRLGIIKPIQAKDDKNIYGSFTLWNYAEWCKSAKKQLNDNPPFAVYNDLCYDGDDGLCYRWITEREKARNFDHNLSTDKIYPYTKAGLLAYVNDLVASEPYDEIIIKDIQR